MSTLSSIPFLRILEIVILSYFLLLNITYLITSIFSFRLLKQYAARLRSVNVEEILTSADAPPVTLLVPAYNEEKNVVDSVRAFLNLSYPEYEIFVINDGSTDETLALLKAKYNLERRHRAAPGDLPTEPVVATYQSKDYDRLWVIDKSNGGKSDALNAGLNFCRTPLYCGMDADTILEKDALIRIVRVFLEDVNTIAVGGILRVANGCDIRHGQINRVGMAKSALAKFQVIEYLRAFLTGRVVWAAFKGMLLISGAFGVFRRESVMEAGGYASHLNMLPTVGEDMELVVRLHRKCYEENRECQVKFIPDPVAWTEVPENIKGLAAQRDRWHRGMFESLFRHRKMLLNKKYGRVGMLAFPYYFIFELMGPLVELAGYIYFVIAIIFGFISVPFAILFFILAVVFGIAISIASVALEEMTFRRYDNFRDLILLCLYTLWEQLGFRQLTMFFRLRGLISALFGRQGWGYQERIGFKQAKKETRQPERDFRKILRR